MFLELEVLLIQLLLGVKIEMDISTTFEHTYHTDGTGAPDHWSEYTTTPTPLYHKWAHIRYHT